jgi:polar amino acid transport system substrate-binding protein
MRTWLLVVVLALAPALWGQNSLKFVFDENSPPYSFVDAQGRLAGLFPELVTLAAGEWPGFQVSFQALPWARAQAMVSSGEADGFLTYPSEVRKLYAKFTPMPLFTEDIGYLVFRADSPLKAKFAQLRSLADLRGLTLMMSVGSEWEQDNIPPDIARIEKTNDRIKLSTLVKRQEGDFTIMGLEQAARLAGELDLVGKLAWQRVDFLPDSQVDFHLGLRSSLRWTPTLLKALDGAFATPAFQKSWRDLLAKYRLKS